ncbi:MAG: LamG domain-containing protein [Chitinophagales bacterium]|nr:LamG domain-containing protein [Chitinophagales bacterium]
MAAMKKLTFCIFPLLLFSCQKEEINTYDVVTGLVASVPLDGSGYEEVNGLNGTNVKAVPVNNRHGEAGKAMFFNSNDSSFIDFGDIASLSFTNNQFTICCWVNVSDSTKPISILSKRGETGPWEFSLDNHFSHKVFTLDNWVEGGSTTVYGTDPLNAAVGIRTGVWSHLAFVADGITLQAYQDGILQAGSDSIRSGSFFSNTVAHFIIGNGGGYGKNYFFNGCIDDVLIYNRPLDKESIQYLSLK